jgi:8-oxo-dGTP diphosphatase
VQEKPFKNKIRLRVNGLLKMDESLLMVQIKSPVNNELVWMPPGGGLEFGESMKTGLKREFFEETGLQIKPGTLAFMNELVEPPFHAVECYFWVKQTGGGLQLGTDPELSKKDQLLQDVRWIPIAQLEEFYVIPEKLSTFVQKSSSKKRSIPIYTETSD